MNAFPTTHFVKGPPLTELSVAMDPESFSIGVSRSSTTPTTATAATTTTHTSTQPRHSPLYSLQLVNAVPVQIDAPNGKKVWRPIVSRVTRITTDAARRVVDHFPTPATRTRRQQKTAWQQISLTTTTNHPTESNQKTPSSSSSSSGYKATLRKWIRRVVKRQRDEPIVAATSSVASTVQEVQATNTMANDSDNDDTTTTLLDSLASHEAAGALHTRPRPRPQPLSPREQETLAAKYAAIDCLEEKAFTILKDLGMVEPSLNFDI